MTKQRTLFLMFLVFAFQACEDCECLDEAIETPIIETCEGTFYVSRFSFDTNTDIRSTAFENFNQPIEDPFNISLIENKNITLFDEAFSSAFGAYDQDNDKYAFLYLLDDSNEVNTLYLADTNTLNTAAIQTVQDQAAPVFLNGVLYTFNAATAVPNVDFEIFSLDQTNGNATQVASGFATVDGQFTNAFISSATNGIDTIYFLGVKTLISYNVLTDDIEVIDINIPYDADIQTALSGLEYRSTTNELIAIHHKLNNPSVIEQLVTINIESGEVALLFDIESNLGAENNDSIELLTNSTTYSACEDTYYITEPLDPEGTEQRSTFISINLTTLTSIDRSTEEFIYGITLDEQN